MCLKKLGVILHVSMTTMEKPSHEDHYALKEKLFFSERETKPKNTRELHKDSGRMEISKTETRGKKSTDY